MTEQEVVAISLEQERKIRKVIKNHTLEMSYKARTELTAELREVALDMLKKYELILPISVNKQKIDFKEFNKEIKRIYILSIVENVLRALNGGQLHKKQILVGEDNVGEEYVINTTTLTVTYKGEVYFLLDMQENEIDKLLLLILANATIKVGATAGKIALIGILQALPSVTFKRVSKLAKSRIRANANISITNVISNNTIRLLKLSGREYTKTWKAILDNLVRDTHEELDGETIKLEDKFFVGGFPARFPRDHSLPPKEKMNCRCEVIYKRI